MRIRSTATDGRIVEGDTSYGCFRVEWAADGALVSHEIEIRTPQQAPQTPATPSIMRPGDVLAWAIQHVTGKPAATCGTCAVHVRTMNEKGWLWCVRNRATVTQWLIEGAKRRGHEINKGDALAMLKVAVKEIKQRGKKP